MLVCIVCVCVCVRVRVCVCVCVCVCQKHDSVTSACASHQIWQAQLPCRVAGGNWYWKLECECVCVCVCVCVCQKHNDDASCLCSTTKISKNTFPVFLQGKQNSEGRKTTVSPVLHQKQQKEDKASSTFGRIIRLYEHSLILLAGYIYL